MRACQNSMKLRDEVKNVFISLPLPSLSRVKVDLGHNESQDSHLILLELEGLCECQNYLYFIISATWPLSPHIGHISSLLFLKSAVLSTQVDHIISSNWPY